METKRTPNFTPDEVDALVDLVKQRKNKLECKNTDKTTVLAKTEEWKIFELEFNAKYQHFYQPWNVLEKKYELWNINPSKLNKYCYLEIFYTNHNSFWGYTRWHIVCSFKMNQLFFWVALKCPILATQVFNTLWCS